MSDTPTTREQWLTALACGGPVCKVDGKDHEMTVKVRTKDGGTMACAKCGARAVDLDILRLP